MAIKEDFDGVVIFQERSSCFPRTRRIMRCASALKTRLDIAKIKLS
jgi:hypothetical protein